MNNLQIFENERFGRVRTIEQNGEPWFIARDVCECLSIGKYRDAVSRLEEDERGRLKWTPLEVGKVYRRSMNMDCTV